MSDDLDAPLGRKKRLPNFRISRADLRGLPFARIGLALLVLLAGGTAARIALVDDPFGGRPVAEVPIGSAKSANSVAQSAATRNETGGTPSAGPSITVLNGPNVTTLTDLPEEDMPAGIAELTAFGVLPDLVEETPNGPIPMVSPAGETPFAAYSRASITPDAANGKPLVAIVVTGLGLNESGTLEAIEKLPDDVTLAFAPYGRTLERTTGAARSGGHELLLQVPLEPFDYPDNDPGPQTLLTGQPPRANLDRLFWLMARFGGYVGLINHMGARFTASAGDFGPVMEELGTRGLGYLDDGTSNRSVALPLAQGNRVPFARADIELDTNPSRAAVLNALQQLEDKARSEGTAIGIASALPVSIEAISTWAREAESRGVLLVPVSALMSRP